MMKKSYRNGRNKCDYFNSANCAHCFTLALFGCALIRLSHMHVHVCLALAVVAHIKIAHDMQMSNFVQIAQYYSCIFFLALQYLQYIQFSQVTSQKNNI